MAHPLAILLFERRSREKLWQLVAVGEIDHVLAVVVRQPVAGTQIERIVAVVKETHRALLIRRVRVSVGEADLDAVTQALFNVGLQRVVGGDAGRGVRLRLGRIADVGNAEVDVSAFKSLQVRLPVRQDAPA